MSGPEHLEIGPAHLHRGPWLLVGALAAALALMLAVVVWPRGERTAPGPSATTSVPDDPPPPWATIGSRPPAQQTPRPSTRATSAPAEPGWRWSTMHGYPDAATELRLLLASREGLVSIDLAAGRIGIFTAPPPATATGLGSIVPLDGGVVFQRPGTPAYRLGNASALRRLSAPPADANVRWFPGPSRQWPLWRDTVQAGRHRVVAVDGQGHTTPLRLPAELAARTVRGDGAGGLLAEAIDGSTYALGLAGATRLTAGRLVAVGPTRLLTQDCDGDGSCSYVVVDRTGQPPRRLPGPTPAATSGSISPDGATAILQTQVSSGQSMQTRLTLIDLATGVRRSAGALDGYVTQFAWSPDGEVIIGNLWVTAPSTTSANPLLVVAARTGAATQLTLPGVNDVTAIAVDTRPRPHWS